MPTAWTPETQLKLALTIIGSMDATSTPPWGQVAAKMGEGYTAESVRQQFQKLKKRMAADSTGTDGSATPKTPRKATNKRKSDEDDDEQTPTPSPKKKKATPKPKSKSKVALKVEPAEHGDAFKPMTMEDADEGF